MFERCYFDIHFHHQRTLQKNLRFENKDFVQKARFPGISDSLPRRNSARYHSLMMHFLNQQTIFHCQQMYALYPHSFKFKTCLFATVLGRKRMQPTGLLSSASPGSDEGCEGETRGASRAPRGSLALFPSANFLRSLNRLPHSSP